MYRIKCYRLASSQFGAAVSYLKGLDGQVKRFLTIDDANEELAKVQATMKSPNLRYEVEEVG